MLIKTDNQGLKNVLPGRPGQVDFATGQATFHSHLPHGQGPGLQVICQLNKKVKLRLATGQVKFESCLSKGQA